MKKNYIKPVLVVQKMKYERALLAGSNEYNATLNSIQLNRGTMEEGNGDDAARQHSYNVWED
ncbi:MAG: hypothetical protein IJS97_08540 [Prevotella sp.]|nr:hypothetical protein [Prevotella sp.]